MIILLFKKSPRRPLVKGALRGLSFFQDQIISIPARVVNSKRQARDLKISLDIEPHNF